MDAIVQVASLAEYHKLSAKLRAIGFKEDVSEGAPLCRWVADEVILDVMPTKESVLGFGNRWYAKAIEHALMIKLPSGQTIRMVSAPYFLITKLEAFDGRGKGDYLLSHDMEDIIAVLDGRPELVDEVMESSTQLLEEVGRRFKQLLKQNRFIDSISGHLPTDEASQRRVGIVLERIKRLGVP